MARRRLALYNECVCVCVSGWVSPPAVGRGVCCGLHL